MEYLRETVGARKSQLMSYISVANAPTRPVVNSSPSKLAPGIVSSNISLLLRNSPALSIQNLDINRLAYVDDAGVRAYIENPLSNIVDGDLNTLFSSPYGERVDLLLYGCF